MPWARFIRIAAIFSMLAAGSRIAHADVIVLANRASIQVPLRFVPATGEAQQVTLNVEETMPFFLDGRADVTFASTGAPKRYTLDANCAYFFYRGPTGQVDLQKIGLGEDGTAFEGRNLAGSARSAPTIKIPVKILVDEEEPARSEVWERRLRARVEAASAILEKYCRVGFQVTAVGTWQSDNGITDFFESLGDFERKVDPAPAKIAIGFTGQFPMARGRIHMAGTRGPLHSHILVREGSPEVHEPERLEFLVHELGHYLGAAHSPELASVMRPVISSRRAGPGGFRIQFDPVNTLAMAMVCEEIRRSHVTRSIELQTVTRRRLEQIYMELSRALPDDPAGMQYAMIMRSGETPITEAAKRVLQQIVAAAINNRSLPVGISTGPNQPARREGDALTDFYVREAARAARTLPEEGAPQAFLLALAIGLDSSKPADNVAGGTSTLRAIEQPSERMSRLAMLGKPTLRGRPDLLQHFFAAAFLTAANGADATQAASVERELRNAQLPVGFSFKLLAADRAGSRFGRSVAVDRRFSLGMLSSIFSGELFMPAVDAFPEGVSAKDLAAQFGAKDDARFVKKLTEIDQQTLLLSGYRKTGTSLGN